MPAGREVHYRVDHAAHQSVQVAISGQRRYKAVLFRSRRNVSLVYNFRSLERS
jgi:hypothetical protein